MSATKTLPKLVVNRSYDAVTGDRLVVRLGDVVLDIAPALDGDSVEVEAYPYTFGHEITYDVWTRGKHGPLKPGQVVTYGTQDQVE